MSKWILTAVMTGILFFFTGTVAAAAAASSSPASPEEEEKTKEKSEAYVIFDLNEAGGDIDFTGADGTKTALSSGDGEIRYSSGDESGPVLSFPGGFEYKRSAANGTATIYIDAADGKIIRSVSVSEGGNEKTMDMKEDAEEYSCSVQIEDETTITISFSEKGAKKDESSGKGSFGNEEAGQNAGAGNTRDESVDCAKGTAAAAASGTTADESLDRKESESAEEKQSAAGSSSEKVSSGKGVSEEKSSEAGTNVSVSGKAEITGEASASGGSGSNVREEAETSSAVSKSSEKIGNAADRPEAEKEDAEEETISPAEGSETDREELSYGITGRAKSRDGLITATIRTETRSVKEGRCKGRNIYSTVYGEIIDGDDCVKKSEDERTDKQLFSQVAFALLHGAAQADETAEKIYSAGNADTDYFITQTVIWGLIYQDQSGCAEQMGMSGVDVSSLTGATPQAENIIGKIKALYNASLEASKGMTDGWLPVQYTIEEPESTLLTEKTENGEKYYVSDLYTIKETINEEVYTEKGTFTASSDQKMPEGTEVVQQNETEETADGYGGKYAFYFRIPAENLRGSGTIPVQLTIPAMDGYAALFQSSGDSEQCVLIWGGRAKKDHVLSTSASYDCPDGSEADSYQAKNDTKTQTENDTAGRKAETEEGKTTTAKQKQDGKSTDSSKKTDISDIEGASTDVAGALGNGIDAVSKAAGSASQTDSRAFSSSIRTESVETGDRNPLFLLILISAGAITALMVCLIIAAGRKDTTETE